MSYFGYCIFQALVTIGTVVADNYFNKNETFWSVQLFTPSSSLTWMPVPSDRYVELLCQWSQIKLLVPLAVNMTLLFWCAIQAFLTRHLPDAFNESWYIFLSVSATLVIWMAFLPTYFMMFYTYYKEALLSLALSLNALCNLVLLFVPKVYAIYWVREDDISSSLSFKNFDNSMVIRPTMAHKTATVSEVSSLSSSNASTI